MRDVIAGISAAVMPRQYVVLASAGTETTLGPFRIADANEVKFAVLVFLWNLMCACMCY